MQELRCLHGHKGAILCCKVHLNSFVTAGHDKKIAIWDAETGKVKLQIIGHEHLISDLDIYSGEQCNDSINEPYILSSSWDSSVKVWNLRTGALLTKFASHKTRVKRVKCLPERLTKPNQCAQAVSGDDDGRIYIWDILTGAALQLLDEHSRFIVSLVAFSTAVDSLFLASASADATICVWNICVPDTSRNDKQSKHPACTSSICAIKTASHHLSAMTVTDLSSASTLLTPTGMRPTGNPKLPLPQISTTPELNSCAPNNNTREPILLAADSLGSIHIYRVQTGVLLARFETKCKIIDLFTSSTARFPYYPSEIDSNQSNNPEGFNRTAIENSQYISTERAILLAQAANIRRSNQIITSLTGTGRSEIQATMANNTVTTAPLYLYYVPENMSLGCFTLSAADNVSSSNSSSSAEAVVNAIIGTHVVSTALCQQLSILRNLNHGTHTPLPATGGPSTGTSAVKTQVARRRPSLLLSSKSETHIPTGNTVSDARKLRKNSTYSGSISAAAGGDGELSDSEDSGLVLERVNTSSGINSSRTSGGVTAVRINPHSTDTPAAMQCFTLTPSSTPAQYVLFGARDGSLYYSSLPSEEDVNNTLSAAAQRDLASQTCGESIAKSAPLQIRTTGAPLPPLLDSPHRAAQAVRSQQLSPSIRNCSTAALVSPAQVPSRGFARYHTAERRSGNSSGSGRVDSYSIRAKPALLSAECCEQEEERTTSEVQRGGEEEAGFYHIGKSQSEDPLDSVSMTDLLSRYDDLFSSNTDSTPVDGSMCTEGAASPLLDALQHYSPDPDPKTKRLLQRLQPFLNEDSDKTLSDHDLSLYAEQTSGTNSNSSVNTVQTDFHTIASTSTLQPDFWQAAQSAKKTFNFRRIKLQKHTASPSTKPAALYQYSDVDTGGGACSAAHGAYHPAGSAQHQAYATGNYPGLGANNSLSRRLLNSNSYATSSRRSHRVGIASTGSAAGRGLARPMPTAAVLQQRPSTTISATATTSSRLSPL